MAALLYPALKDGAWRRRMGQTIEEPFPFHFGIKLAVFKNSILLLVTKIERYFPKSFMF
jgi:hypothetical protein